MKVRKTRADLNDYKLVLKRPRKKVYKNGPAREHVSSWLRRLVLEISDTAVAAVQARPSSGEDEQGIGSFKDETFQHWVALGLVGPLPTSASTTCPTSKRAKRLRLTRIGAIPCDEQDQPLPVSCVTTKQSQSSTDSTITVATKISASVAATSSSDGSDKKGRTQDLSPNAISGTSRAYSIPVATRVTTIAWRGRSVQMQKARPNPYVDVDEKYWGQRYRYFSRFDEGIEMTGAQAWFSATPEVIAEHIAERCRCDIVVDAFAGCGANAIQLAFTCHHVIAIDLNRASLECARRNAAIYGVADRIEFLHGDALQLIPKLRGVDVIFLSPPWGGPAYVDADVYDLRSLRVGNDSYCGGKRGVDGVELLRLCQGVTPSIAFYLPKNSCADQVAAVTAPLTPRGAEARLEFEQLYLNKKYKAAVAYFGELAA